MSDEALVTALRGAHSAAAVPESAAERVAGVLRQQIIDGALPPGTRLTEETIAAGLGYSRNTVRESFTLLVAERVAVHEPRRGVFVAQPTAADVRDLYATRRAVEPGAVEHGRGYDQSTPARLREVVDAARAADERGDTAGVSQGNQHFHRALARLSGSRRVDQLMEGVLAEMRLVFHGMSGRPDFHRSYLRRNEEVVALLEAGDRAGAARALEAYLDDAEAEVLGAMGEPDGRDAGVLSRGQGSR